jgi:carotenoid cleavage dioxygenase-like enzyme
MVGLPVSLLMADFCVTKSHVVFHVLPLHCDVERLKKGGKHFAWDDSLPLYFGILPRYNPKPSDIKWFHNTNAYIAHIGNAYDGPDGVVYYDSPLSYGNKFGGMFPSDKPGAPEHDPTASIKSHYVRWKLDPHAKSDFVEPIELADVDGEMPTVDPRIASLDYEYVFMACFDKSQMDNGQQAIWYVTVKNDLTLGGSTTAAVK